MPEDSTTACPAGALAAFAKSSFGAAGLEDDKARASAEVEGVRLDPGIMAALQSLAGQLGVVPPRQRA